MRLMSSLFARLALLFALASLAACSAPDTTPDDTPPGGVADVDPGPQRTLHFGIIATESSSNLESNWRPFIAAMEEWTGYDIEPYYASDYAGMI